MNRLALEHQPEAERALRSSGAEVVRLAPIGASDQAVPRRRDAAGAVEAVDPDRCGLSRPLIPRPALFQRLSEGSHVTVVSGPAASGKTSLLRSWLTEAGMHRRAAWTTVRREERDGQQFWESVIDALAALADDVPPRSVSAARGMPSEALAERLSLTLHKIDEPAVLIIDDLQELRAADALALLESCLAHLPAQLRVVLSTRMDPGLGLHRLRLSGTLTDLRPADLRFSLEETRELLAASGILLSEEGAATLHRRTEGWAGGLRLAAISMAGHPDPEQFAADFCGTERTVATFLRVEVLDRQAPEVRDMLMRTSVLDHVNGPLADALTGRMGSLDILEQLDASNAFVAAVDVGRTWFRYHGMLADLLRRELRRLDPARVGPLHRAAARWFEENGDAVKAIRHAQAAGDWADAARLLADHQFDLTLDGNMAEIRALLATFPSGAATADGELALAAATALLIDGRQEEATAQLGVAERLAATVTVDRRARFDLARAEITLRLACVRGETDRVPAAARAVDAALKVALPSDVMRAETHRAAALVDLGIAQLWSMRLEDARRHLEEALELARRVERPSIEVACLSYLALAATLSGRPASVARPLVEQATSLVETCPCKTIASSAAAAFAVGGITFLWLGRLAEAEQWLKRAQGALTPATAPALVLLVHHTWALLRLGQQQFDHALTALQDAERVQERLVSEHPLTRDLRSRLLRTQIRRGETAAARAALESIGADARRRGEVRIAAAAVKLAEECPAEARDELRPVIEATAPACVYGWAATIEALLYDALAGRGVGDASGAEASLERALELAEPEGTLLPFTLVPVHDLLERHRGHRTAHAMLRATTLGLLAGSARAREPAPLVDPLSDAELRVVRYLSGNLKGPEMAAELCVSPNTIRTHLRHIYAKLDVHTRREAVARARQLGLLAPA
jgi:LuxR family transcriptional regulator, maltose regulon positive regulatory protein